MAVFIVRQVRFSHILHPTDVHIGLLRLHHLGLVIFTLYWSYKLTYVLRSGTGTGTHHIRLPNWSAHDFPVMSRCGSQWVSDWLPCLSVKSITPFGFSSIAVPDFDAVEKFNVSQANAYTRILWAILL